jgi:dTDP-4-amino-4,6-dideoxygalactose transaminase
LKDKLAIFGGKPVRESPLPPWPYYAEDEVDAVSEVMRSGKVNAWTGDDVEEFECQFAEKIGLRYGIAVANGTVALELALRALGIGEGDEVVVTSRTFVASASSIVAVGAVPIFADVDPESQNITAKTISAVLSEKTRAVILVHLAGWPCDMGSIVELAKERDLRLIEDCAQAHGAQYHGRSVGSFGDIAAFSFCQDKIISTGGEGGMLVTDDDALRSYARSYKDHGKNWDAIAQDTGGVGFRWVHDDFGTNWRLSGIQAAIGLRQLEKLDRWVELRNSNAATLNAGLDGIDLLRLTLPPEHIYHAYYKYYVFIRPEKLKSGWSRDRLLEAIRAEGIPCAPGSCSEVYLEQAFNGSPSRPVERLPVARQLGETSIMLPLHPTLDASDIDDMVTAICKVAEAATA